MTSDSSGSSDSGRQYDAIAELYDGYPGNYLEDVLFYAEEAKRVSAPVLEVGVGTGRLAFCLAAVGVDVVGIDSSVPMLRLLARKRHTVGAQPGRVQALAADMRQFSLRRRFQLAIVAFRTFLYLLIEEDRRRTLLAIRQHLTPDGILAMSFFVPPKQFLTAGGTGRHEVTRFAAPDGKGEVVAYDEAEVIGERRQIISHLTYEWRNASGRRVRHLAHDMTMRYLFPEE
ncbi:MAG: class I SAM-dependent methyltransferase, partial [Armatimonadetes bacterium]|nr:class I SAM-dependent methyltransferase [Armatimonadota bacterium]